MNAKELRELNIEDLRQKENDFKQELFNLRFQTVTGKLENTSRLKQIRRDIARVKTLIREKELGGGN